MSKEERNPTKPSINGSHVQTEEEKKFAEIIMKSKKYDQIKQELAELKDFISSLKLEIEIEDYDCNDISCSCECLVSKNENVELNCGDEKIIEMYRKICKGVNE